MYLTPHIDLFWVTGWLRGGLSACSTPLAVTTLIKLSQYFFFTYISILQTSPPLSFSPSSLSLSLYWLQNADRAPVFLPQHLSPRLQTATVYHFKFRAKWENKPNRLHSFSIHNTWGGEGRIGISYATPHTSLPATNYSLSPCVILPPFFL